MIIAREESSSGRRVTQFDLYLGHVSKWIELFTDPESEPQPEVRDFMSTANIIAVIGVDMDESDYYVLYEE